VVEDPKAPEPEVAAAVSEQPVEEEAAKEESVAPSSKIGKAESETRMNDDDELKKTEPVPDVATEEVKEKPSSAAEATEEKKEEVPADKVPESKVVPKDNQP